MSIFPVRTGGRYISPFRRFGLVVKRPAVPGFFRYQRTQLRTPRLRIEVPQPLVPLQNPVRRPIVRFYIPLRYNVPSIFGGIPQCCPAESVPLDQSTNPFIQHLRLRLPVKRIADPHQPQNFVKSHFNPFDSNTHASPLA